MSPVMVGGYHAGTRERPGDLAGLWFWSVGMIGAFFDGLPVPEYTIVPIQHLAFPAAANDPRPFPLWMMQVADMLHESEGE